MKNIFRSLVYLFLIPNLFLAQNSQTEHKNNIGESDLTYTNSRLLLNKNKQQLLE